MAVSYAKSGQWDMVLDTMKTAEEAGISFDDADIFSVILACTDGGLHEQSETLIEKLPMKRGYFQAELQRRFFEDLGEGLCKYLL